MTPVSRPLLRLVRGALLMLWAVVWLVPNMLPAQTPPAQGPANRPRFVEGELLVKFRGGPRSEGARRARADLRHNVKRDFEHVGWQHLTLPSGVTVEQALERYRRHPDVLAVEPNHIFEAVVPEPVTPSPAPVLKAANASPGINPE